MLSTTQQEAVTTAYASDMDPFAGYCPACMVHKAVLAQYNSIMPAIVKYFVDAGITDQSVVYTGHSWGGALATVAAMDLVGPHGCAD